VVTQISTTSTQTGLNRSGRTSPVFNPATGGQTGSVSIANAADVATSLRQQGLRRMGSTTALRRAG
jgi:malonate-semialdehyde dehydrogenase (acetylating)/methylmalonate-semialdehyde dehydrogenase